MVKEKYYGYCRYMIIDREHSILKSFNEYTDIHSWLSIYDLTIGRIDELIKKFVCNSIRDELNNEKFSI